ncbi:serine--tRNA ligase, chloroplastic/mitochondrial [Drosophila ficusphila]|uniref:serine--tRNA ligase, chloroplastic/mitochondrial n=1 Tax=Drosophila ficusphila TaxID=30025 RepID=UPI0007E61F5A|nr:serine--tRNA ligase, chloroplastic/mitochondrial [Drosophila ficusphila]
MKLLTNSRLLRPLLLLRRQRSHDAKAAPKPGRPVPTGDQLDELERNVIVRHHRNNVPLIRSLIQEAEAGDQDKLFQLQAELEQLPNLTHPRLEDYGEEPRELANYVHRELPPQSSLKEFSELARALNLYRMDHLGNYTGHKSYYLTGQLATLEQALIQYALQAVTNHGFKLISVPDILPKEIIESCGMRTEGERTQVYKLDNGECLSGTSEMALAGFFANKQLQEEQLPLKVTAVSRCYRAETSGLQEEKGIYRVHQFTKVEMFAICTEEQSEAELEEFKNIEVDLFRRLGLNFRLLDMPPCELGAPAYQKYDIEAWMPGRQMWGEISSCSNCTDYQARRLGIRYRRSRDGKILNAHTINGTATAIPRLLIALLESYQRGDAIEIPAVLRPFLDDQELITRNKRIPETKLVKFIKA